MKPDENIDDVLKRVLGHKVTMHYTLPEEMRMRETNGFLEDFNKAIIKLRQLNVFGEVSYFYINRHACTLLSIADEGKVEKVDS